MFKNTQDAILLLDCKAAVLTEKKSTARVLEYLSEVYRRRLWEREGYSSLHNFCIRYLNYSESEANRRVQACHLTERVVEVKPLLEAGSLSLTTMSLLSPYLTNDNAKEILPKVISQPTREVERVLAEVFPERAAKVEVFQAKLDAELKALIEKAQELASEKDDARLLKKVLQSYVREKESRDSKVKRHTRYVQKSLAREVKKRDGNQCTYFSSTKVRCNQRAHLQIDHIRPYALGGSSQDIDNLRVLCRVHNLYKARLDFPDKTFVRAKTP